MIDFTTKPISNSVVIVKVTGQLAEMEREYFFSCVGDLIDAGYSHVVVECLGLGFVSSNGLAALLQARKRAIKEGGRIYLSHLNSTISEVLEVTKLGRLLSVYPTTEAALRSMEKNEFACNG